MSDWFDEAQGGGRVDVPKLLDSTAGGGLTELVAAGALVSLGLTRDGGALGVTVTVDGRWKRGYFRDEDELGLFVAQALPAVHAALGTSQPPADAKPASSGRGRGSRTARTR